MRLRAHGYRFEEMEVGRPLLGMHEHQPDAAAHKAGDRQAEAAPANNAGTSPNRAVVPAAPISASRATIRTLEEQPLVRPACIKRTKIES
jgi:hypothetical protein